jgi:hypothetical protein
MQHAIDHSEVYQPHWRMRASLTDSLTSPSRLPAWRPILAMHCALPSAAAASVAGGGTAFPLRGQDDVAVPCGPRHQPHGAQHQRTVSIPSPVAPLSSAASRYP